MKLKKGLRNKRLHSVCEEAQCPNIGECWGGGTAAIMLLGDTCTRGCRFCAIRTSNKPQAPDMLEPFNTAIAVANWGVDYVVITSVDRDDLPDGGAGHFAKTVGFINFISPEMGVECLVGDFQGNKTSIEIAASSGMDVFAHNIETVERLQRYVRDRRASYNQSLFTLRYAKEMNPLLYTKSSIMLGLGESHDEVVQAMKDLRKNNVDIVTLGQYLRPSEQHLQVLEYVHPDKFEIFREIGEEMGFKFVASGPMVRSSYRAGELFLANLVRRKNQLINQGMDIEDL
eukprot:Filipodium_phascolosomae@DN1888_c0_g1_i1.p1